MSAVPVSGRVTPKADPGVPGWVGQQYYRHGLFCASHPRLVLLITAIGVAWTCMPLIFVPIYSGEVQLFRSSSVSSSSNLVPHWMSEGRPPVAFVLQIIMKAMVQPYKKEELIRTDAFRGPIATAFKLHLEDLKNFQDMRTGLNMDSECLRTDGLSPRYKTSSTVNVLPDYGCLILSPANLWKRDPVVFQMDSNIVQTIFSYQKSSEGHSSLADLMFGMRQRDTGLTKYPIRNRQRVITYAVTLALKTYDFKFIEALRSHLKAMYPLPTGNTSDETVHMFFPSRSYATEFLPFFFTLLLLWAYVYFSCKKIELVYSKAGIAFSAVVVVLGSIMLSLALSGLTLNMSSKMCVVPYLVTFISLENLMVITRSVVTTQAHLDVKIRVAQGLSREGWSITKNLLTEITILTLGFFIGILDPSIQEFCLLLVMGLLSDFFLQTFFFTSVLSMDMSRMELSDVARKPVYKRKEIFQHPVSGPGMKKTSLDRQTSVLAPQCSQLVKEGEPKRVKFINFWAKRRIIQRLFILCMIVWISMFVYQTSLLESFYRAHQDHPSFHVDLDNATEKSDGANSALYQNAVNISAIISDLDLAVTQKDSNRMQSTYKKLLHGSSNTWNRLPHTHWPMLFGLYNMTVYGDYISLLPPIHLSMIINPDSAKQLRHPLEELKAKEEVAIHSVEGLRTALELNDEEDEEEPGSISDSPELSPFVPTSPGELFLAFLFVFPSLLFVLYMLVVFYRCICSRNYAEWRTSWDGQDSKNSADIYTQIVQESVPIVVEGHSHEIECIVTNDIGNLIVSLCLEGRINTWDSYSGDKLASIDRNKGRLRNDEDRDTRCCSSPPTSPWGGVTDLKSSSPPAGSSPKSPYDVSCPPPFKMNTNFSSQKRGVKHSTDSFLSSFGTREMAEDDLSPRSPSDDSALAAAVWSLDCNDRLLVLGLASGGIELWDARDGTLKFEYCDPSGVGITHIKLIGDKLIAARLIGGIDFFEVFSNAVANCSVVGGGGSAPVKRFRSHSKDLTGRRPSSSDAGCIDIAIRLSQSVRAHQQPVNCLESGGGRVLTGSMDHTLRVFRLEDHFNIFTLHGHCGPITTAFIDPLMVNCAGSGSQDGMVCVWDLLTGACLYSILAHDGPVLSLTHSPSYVISMGADAKLCVWERFQGHLINSISMFGECHCYDIAMLTHNLMVTSGSDSLIVWDARLPDPVKLVRLGDRSETHKISMLKHLGDTIACNFGNQLRLVHFPLLSDKKD